MRVQRLARKPKLTSAKEAIKYALDTKQAITADNGNIRLERSSLGNWQLSVPWQDKTGFDDDSIVMDTDLSLLTISLQ